MRHYRLISLLLVVILSPGQSRPGGITESQLNLHNASMQSSANDLREVIIATQRNRRLHIFDANTLRPLGYFTVNDNAHSVVASPDGLKLFLEQPAPPDANSCCTLFALDLITHKLCKLIFPSSLGVPSPDGRWVFTQRGPIGIEVFDANQGNLWKVTPETTKLDAPLKIALPASFPKNRFILHKLIAGGKHLFLYEGFGHKLDPRSSSSEEIPGGIFSIEPSSGKIVGHFARSVHYPYRE